MPTLPPPSPSTSTSTSTAPASSAPSGPAPRPAGRRRAPSGIPPSTPGPAPDGAPEAFRALATLQRHAPGHEGLERLAAELAARLAADLARAAAPRLLGLLRRGAAQEEAEAVLGGLEPLLAEYGLVLGRRWRAARDGVFVFAAPARPGATYAGATARAVPVVGAAPPPEAGEPAPARAEPPFPPRLDIA